MKGPREALRGVLEGNSCVAAAPVFDPLSARIAELSGWEICKLSGAFGKAANFALPDTGPILHIADLADICRGITRVANVSLIVDADDGGEGPLNVLRTVRELEAAGVSGIEIEDNRVPPRLTSGVPRHSLLIDESEQLHRYEAAVAARRDASTVIIARTSAMEFLPYEQGLARIRSYATTGVEAIMLPTMPREGRSALEAIHEGARLPLCVLGLPADIAVDAAFLNKNQIRVRFCRHLPFMMAIRAMYEAFTLLRSPAFQVEDRDVEQIGKLKAGIIGLPDLIRWEEAYGPDS